MKHEIRIIEQSIGTCVNIIIVLNLVNENTMEKYIPTYTFNKTQKTTITLI